MSANPDIIIATPGRFLVSHPYIMGSLHMTEPIDTASEGGNEFGLVIDPIRGV